MVKNFTRRIALAATAMGVVLTTPALAQEAAGASEADIIVTARRMDERLQDVPISITVYNPEQLAARNIVNSTDLATYTPSLTVNSRYGPDKSSFAIRGFSQDLNTLPTVGVYFADAVAPRLSSNITSGNGAGVGSMFDLQNVQVLKGPQGTLFGRNTTGGAVLLVPQRPTDRLEGYVEGTLGDYNQRRIEAVVNVPLGDTIRFRAGVDRNLRDGYLRNRSGIGPDHFNDVDYWAARASLVIDVTPDLENYTVFTWAKSDTNGYLGKYAYCNRGTVPNSDGNVGTALASRAANCAELDRQIAAGYGFYDVANNNTTPFIRNETWQVINTTTWKASDTLTVKNIFSYGIAKEAYSFNLSGDNIARPFVITNPGPDGSVQGHQWTLTEELQLQGRTADDSLTWQVGGYLEHSKPKSEQTQYTAILSDCKSPQQVYTFTCTALGNIGIAHNNYFYKNYGLYAQATYKLTEQFSVTAGIRNTWDRQRVEANNITVVPSVNGPTAFRCSRAVTPAGGANSDLLTNGACGIGRTFRTESSKPTWLINVDYKPTQDMMLYAKYARGYRGGGLNEANFGFEAWQPEFVDNYEIGLKTSFSGTDVRGTFNLAGYWNEFKDQQVSVFIPQCLSDVNSGGRASCTAPAPTGINGIQNVGKSRLRGIEADGSLMIGDSWRFDFGYAYNDAKVTDGGSRLPSCDNTRFNCDQAVFLTKGTVLPYAPKNRVTLTATYTLPVPEEVGRVSFGATFTHTDKYFSNHGNDRAFAQGAVPFNASIAPATDLLNLNFNWSSIAGSPVDLAVFMTNVTGEKYWVSSSNGISSSGAEWLILGAPRMYGVRVKVRFGN